MQVRPCQCRRCCWGGQPGAAATWQGRLGRPDPAAIMSHCLLVTRHAHGSVCGSSSSNLLRAPSLLQGWPLRPWMSPWRLQCAGPWARLKLLPRSNPSWTSRLPHVHCWQGHTAGTPIDARLCFGSSKRCPSLWARLGAQRSPLPPCCCSCCCCQMLLLLQGRCCQKVHLLLL